MSQKLEGTDSSTEERRTSPVKSEECNDESELRTEPAAEWTEEQAFASVHDLVHYAILSQTGRSASLRQIYTTCEQKGRIAYKHGKGSRLITANEHWKSQIRHALYTSPRFSRIQGGDDWSVSSGHGDMPKTTTVRVSTASTSTTTAVKEVKEVEQRPRRKASLGVAVVVRGEEAAGGARSPKRGGNGVNGTNRIGKRSRLGQTSPENSEAVETGGTGTPMPAGSTQTRWPLSEVAGLAAAAMLEADLDANLKPEQAENIKKSSGTESPPDSSNPSRCGSPAPSASIVVAVGCRSIVPKARDPSRNRRKPAQGLQAAMPSGSSSPGGTINSMFIERRNSMNLDRQSSGGVILERQSSLSHGTKVEPAIVTTR